MSRSVQTLVFSLMLVMGGTGLTGCVGEPVDSEESLVGIEDVSEAVEVGDEDAVELEGAEASALTADWLVHPTDDGLGEEAHALDVEPADTMVPSLPGVDVMGPEPEPWDGCYGPGCVHRELDDAQSNPTPETPSDPDPV